MTTPTTPERTGQRPGGIRWWPAALVLAGSGGVLFWNRVIRAAAGQDRFLTGAITVGVTTILLLLWVALLSRMRWRSRLVIVVGALVVVGTGFATLRVGDVSGDLVPILSWKWSGEPSVDMQVPLAEALSMSSSARSSSAAGSGLPPLAGLADYPQFLGPDRNATVAGVRLAQDWQVHPPREAWRRPVGAGYSAFSVSGRRAITQEQRGEQETVVCYDISTGEVLWSHADNARYESTIGGVGPRATPAIVDGRVYSFGATGLLNCLDLRTGERLWGRNAVEDAGAKINSWGMSGSPLVLGRRVVINGGGREGKSLAAYDHLTGELVWSGGDDSASYSSPMLAVFAAMEQIVILNDHSVVGHDPATGSVLWSHPWSGKQPKVAQPLGLPGDRLFASSGYSVGGASLRISRDVDSETGWSVQREWQTSRMKAKFANMAYRDGHIYGFDDGILASVNAATGERNWKRGRYGHGQLILVGDVLLVTSESGEIVLVEASPQRHREVARFEVLDDKTWNSPALAGRHLLVRNHREAVCLELAVEEGP